MSGRTPQKSRIGTHAAALGGRRGPWPDSGFAVDAHDSIGVLIGVSIGVVASLAGEGTPELLIEAAHRHP